MSGNDKKEEKKEKEKEKEEDATHFELIAQQSIRVLPKMTVTEEDKGEKLSECTDREWDASDEPFSAELLNVKNAPNRVSVFSGPCRSKEIVETITKTKPPAPIVVAAPDDRADRLAQMMGRIFSEIIDGRDLSQIKVTISTRREKQQ
ncbi:unnamed protein product [Caenorhabditis sp. 36 PRJEB53466]|nr:unnamed protein product [Caenorhabditis sp. 36 PRJEB53466]